MTIIFNNNSALSLARTFSQTFFRYHVHQQRQQLKVLCPLPHTILLHNSKCSTYTQKFTSSNQCLNTTKFVQALFRFIKFVDSVVHMYNYHIVLFFVCLVSMLIYSFLSIVQPI